MVASKKMIGPYYDRLIILSKRFSIYAFYVVDIFVRCLTTAVDPASGSTSPRREGARGVWVNHCIYFVRCLTTAVDPGSGSTAPPREGAPGVWVNHCI